MSEKCKCGATFSVCALKTVCRIMRRLVGSVVWACNIKTVPPPFKRFKLLQRSLRRSRTIIVRNFYPSSICFGQRASRQSGFPFQMCQIAYTSESLAISRSSVGLARLQLVRMLDLPLNPDALDNIGSGKKATNSPIKISSRTKNFIGTSANATLENS